jgi:uncharacterized protein (DUF58 family)
MWFNRKKKSSAAKQQNNICKSLLTELSSNGITLSMQELLQYQSKTRLIDLANKRNIQGKQAGNYLARSKGRGMEFDEVRHYQTGDDVRAIDWRVTARTGKTHTKLFREEVERPVLVATDLSANMQFGSKLLYKSVQAAHLAALVAWHAKNRGDRLGGLVFNETHHIELKPKSRKAGVLHYLHALTIVNNQHLSKNLYSTKASLPVNNQDLDESGVIDQTSLRENTFEQQCARLRHLAKPGSLVYLITDGFALQDSQDCPHVLRHLSQISQHCELVVCMISDPLEQTLPKSHFKLPVSLTDGVNRQQLTLGDLDTAELYHQKAIEQTNDMQQSFSSVGARVISFSAGQPLEQQLSFGGSL